MNKEDISVLVCDDSALMRNLISRIIENTQGLSVCAKAMNGEIALEKIAEAKPDVIVLCDEEEKDGCGTARERWCPYVGILAYGSV